MPFSVRVDSDAGIVIGTCSGVLGLEDARAGATTVWQNPVWSGKPVVWDFRSARLDVGGPEVREFARFILDKQPPSPPSRIALVTASDADFGLSRMFEVFRQHPSTEVRTFRDYDEAVSWARSGGASGT